MTSRQLPAFFFTPLEPGIYRCNICELPRKQASCEYAAFQCSKLTSLEAFGFVDAVTSDIYDWLWWVVERNLTLCEVENPLTRKLVKMQLTSIVTLQTYMQRVATRVGTTLAEAMALSVCMKLQNRDGVTLLDARILFDKLLDVFKEEGSCVKHLSQGAKVVEVPDVENGIVKVQDGRANELTRSEKKSLNRFLRTADDGSSFRDPETLGFADSALKEKREHLEPKYVNLDWIPPTSDDVERLFSLAGLIYSNRRMAMLPDTLELILYLRFNRHLWNEVTVAEAIRRREESRRRKRQLRLDEVERSGKCSVVVIGKSPLMDNGPSGGTKGKVVHPPYPMIIFATLVETMTFSHSHPSAAASV